MKKKYNYNYVIVMYDVGIKRNHKIFKICKKYLNHFQNSIFRGEITPSNILRLESDLKEEIDLECDSITILKFIGVNQIEEENFGVKKNSDVEYDFFV